MKRFRLLGFYVVGVVAVIALAIVGVSIKRTTANAGTPSASEAGPIVPATANTEPSPVHGTAGRRRANRSYPYDGFHAAPAQME